MVEERRRLQDPAMSRKKWGPYLSERQWGTVREDYSAGGNAWDYFSHDQRARARIAGAKAAWPDSPTSSAGFVSPPPSGTARTPSSRNACSV